MPRKKKKTEEEAVQDVTTKVVELLPIAELLKNEATILGESSEGKLPRNAEFSPRFLDMATRLVSAGFSEKDLAFVIGTTIARIKYWKRHNPIFKKACDDGKQMAKSYLISQGLRAAAGYNSIEKNFKIKRKVLDNGTIVEYAAEESHFHKHVKPDSKLLVFLLCNISRQMKDKEPWTSEHKIEIEDKKSLNIKIQGKVVTEQINRLAGAFMPEITEAEFVDEKTDNTSKRPKRLSPSDTETHSKQ
jgi:hypothetical protein